MSGYIGLPPNGYAKPLEVAQNLADVPNKALALTNLGAAKADDVIQSANPIGTIIAFWGSSAPAGYLPCAGQTVSSTIYPQLVTFLGGTTSATLPDLRGEFLRGWDNGRGVDNGRANLSSQLDQFQGHIHGPGSGQFMKGGINGGINASAGSLATYNGGPTGVPDSDGTNGTPRTGSETRPRNVTVLYCIKAYAAVVSAGTVNLNALISMAATSVQLTDFGGTNQVLAGAAGYQKLPGGLIIQWGRTPSVANGASYLGSYPTTFPNTTAVGFAIGEVQGISAAAPYSFIRTSNSTFTVYNSDSIAKVLQWVAYGY